MPSPFRLLLLLSLVAGLPASAAEQPKSSQLDLTDAKPQSLTGERRAAFEAYVADAILRFGVPGAAVAVVEQGDVVYLNGFGVKQAGGTQPVTPDTMMMIGSITKPMTTMLAAALVGDGRLTWDTRLIDLLPDFAVGDPALTKTLTIRDAFCNCSGISGRNIETSFEGGELTPGAVVRSLARVVPISRHGEQFIYNNLLVATGGYALGVANGGGAGDIGAAYDLALRERVLAPIGMMRSTFDPNAILADGDYALPHAVDLSGKLRPLPLVAERGLLPYRPAGALWSNGREMARFLQTLLALGVAPGGARVASAADLEATWGRGSVSVPNFFGGPPEMAATMTRYGLGWMIGQYRGLRVVNHAGGTGGFTAIVSFLPDANLGIVILSNSFSLAPIPLAFEYAVEFRLFELLFDQPAEFEDALLAKAKDFEAALPRVALAKVDPAAVAQYLGRYDNADLGAVTLSLRGDRLILDAGELASELRPRAAGGGETVFLLHDPPLSLFSEAYGVTVKLTGGREDPRMIIAVPASVTGPEQRFLFQPRS